MTESGANPRFETTFEYRADLLRSAYWRLLMQSSGVYGLALVLVTSVLAAAWAYAPSSVGAGSLCSFFVGVAFSYWNQARKVSGQVAETVHEMGNPTVRVTIDESGFRVESSLGTAVHPWRSVRALHDFPRCSVVCGPRHRILFVLEKGALGVEAIQFLRSRLTSATATAKARPAPP